MESCTCGQRPVFITAAQYAAMPWAARQRLAYRLRPWPRAELRVVMPPSSQPAPHLSPIQTYALACDLLAAIPPDPWELVEARRKDLIQATKPRRREPA